MKTIEEIVNDLLRVRREIPEITYVGEPILRAKATEVSLTEGKEVAQKLQSILKRYRAVAGMGRGLAAPQIGIGKAVFVTFVDDVFQTYINPVITQSSGSNYFRELCISSGVMWADVQRAEKIVMRWTDEASEKHEEQFDGFLARLLQHEYDHLQGVVNIDRAEKGSLEFALGNPMEQKLRDSRG